MATITSLTFAISSTYSGSGMRQARRDLDDFDNGLNAMSKASSNIGAQLSSITNAALLLGPALVPIAAVSAGVAGGLLASGAAAGAAAGIFGGAMAGAMKQVDSEMKTVQKGLDTQRATLANLTPGTKAYAAQLVKVKLAEEKMKNALDGLDPAQKRYYQSTMDMRESWRGFIEATRADTLAPVSTVIEAINRNLSKFVPVVKAVAPLVAGLAKDFAGWLDGKGLARFIQLTITQGVPALANFVKIGKNIVTVLGQGFRDFLPFGNRVVAKLAEGSTVLKNWAAGGGFQRFMDKVQALAPSVGDFFKSLTTALINIAKAAAQLSGTSFSVLTVLLQVLASFPPTLLATMVRGYLALNAAIIIYNIVGGIAAAVTATMALAAAPFGLLMIGAALTIGAVVLALIALGVGIYFLVKNWSTVSAFFVATWDATWNLIKNTALTVWGFLSHGWGQFVLLLLGPIGLLTLMYLHWRDIWGAIQVAAQVVWDALKIAWSASIGWLSGAWDTVLGGLLTAWNAFSSPFLTSWNTVWPQVQQAAANIWTGLEVAWGVLWTGVTAVWNVFWGLFGGTFTTAWSGATGTATAAWDLLTAAWSLVWAVIQGIYQIAWATLSGSWSIGWAFLTGTAQISWAILTGAWSVIWAVVTGIWNTFYAVFSAIFSGAWNVIVAIVTGIWNVISAAWDALWKVVTAIFLTFTAIFTGNWGMAWNAIKDAGAAIWNLITTAWQAFLNVVAAVFSAFVGVLSAAWHAFWAAIQTVASTAWAAFRGVFQVFLTAVQAVWNAVWAAVRMIFQTDINAVITVASAAWTTIRAAVGVFLTAVQAVWNTAWTAVRTLFQTAVNGVITAATVFWAAIRTAFSAGSTWLLNTFWNPVHNFFTKTVPAAFDTGVKALGTAWDKLKKLVRDPIQAIVNVVYNNGIVKLWNAVAGVFGAPKLGAFTLPAFKTGGPTGQGPGTGFPALLHPNEHVWTADEVRGAGGHKAVAALRSQAMGGAKVRTFGGTSFDNGGGFLGTGVGPSLGDIGGALGNAAGTVGGALGNAVGAVGGAIGSVVGKLKDLALGAISGPFSAAVDAMAKGAKGVVRGIVPGDGLPMETLAVGMIDKIADTVKAWVKSKDIAPDVAGGSAADALIWAKAQAGKPYQWGAVGPSAYDCSGFMGAIQNVIMGKKPNTRVWATGAFNGGTAPSGWKYHEKAPFTVGITNSGVGHTAGTLNGVNVESRGGRGVVIGSGARGYNDSLFNSWYGFLPSKNAGGSTSGAAQATAKAMLSKYGWNDSQWPSLQKLWEGESGWRWNATNASSGAYGIPQALPASKMASAGSDWKTNAATQIKWGEGYIKSVYGSPSSAYAKWQGRSPHWYGLGTPGANSGPAWVGETEPELVNFRGGERVDPLSKLVGKSGGGGDTITITIPISGNVDHGVVDRLERETIPKLRMALQQGVGRRR